MRFIILLLARWTCPNNRLTYPTQPQVPDRNGKIFTLLLLLYRTSVKSQGMKQLMAGGGIILLGTTLIPLLSGLFLR